VCMDDGRGNEGEVKVEGEFFCKQIIKLVKLMY
jgi:hypothetical protein